MRMPFLAVPVGRASTQARVVRTAAHRGASAVAPENTLAAVRRAISLGTDLIELDVQRSKDGALVLLHDSTLTRTTNVRQVFPGRGPWLVREFTLEEIQRLDAGRWKSPDFAGERVPTLEEAIQVVRPSRAGLQLELKATASLPGMVPELVVALRAISGYVDSAARTRRLVVQSFDHESMRRHKELEPSVPVGLLGAPARSRLPMLSTWADQVNPAHRRVDASYVSAVHDQGMECLVWTVNREPAMRRALDMGVDGVITDHPDLLRRVLARQALTTPETPPEAATINFPVGPLRTRPLGSTSILA